GLTADAHDTGSRGQIDDGPAAAFAHGGDLVLHREEDTGEVDREETVPVVLVGLIERCRRLFDSGIVDREVDPAEFVDGRGDGRLDGACVGDVGDDGAGAPTGVPDQSGGLVQVVLADRDQGDVGAGLGAGESGGAADADAGSRDEGDLVGEVRG